MAVLVFVFVAVVVVVFSFLSRFEKVSEQALVGDKKCTPLFTSATNPPLFFFFFFHVSKRGDLAHSSGSYRMNQRGRHRPQRGGPLTQKGDAQGKKGKEFILEVFFSLRFSLAPPPPLGLLLFSPHSFSFYPPFPPLPPPEVAFNHQYMPIPVLKERERERKSKREREREFFLSSTGPALPTNRKKKKKKKHTHRASSAPSPAPTAGPRPRTSPPRSAQPRPGGSAPCSRAGAPRAC